MNEEKSKVIDTLAEYSIIFFIAGAIAIGIFSTIFFTNYDLALITNLFYNGLIFYSCLSGIIIGIVNFIVAYLFIKKKKIHRFRKIHYNYSSSSKVLFIRMEKHNQTGCDLLEKGWSL